MDGGDEGFGRQMGSELEVHEAKVEAASGV